MANDKQLGAVINALERTAKAQEDLLELAKDEVVTIERGPSICPGCGKPNPEITQLAVDGSGKIDEFVLMAETHCCNKTIYGIPDAWSLVRDKTEAIAFMEMKKGGGHG